MRIYYNTKFEYTGNYQDYKSLEKQLTPGAVMDKFSQLMAEAEKTRKSVLDNLLDKYKLE